MISNMLDRRSFMKTCASAVAFLPLLARGANSGTSSENLGQMAGGGNFLNNETPAGQYDVLNALGAKVARMAVYPAWYVEGGNPGNNDNAVIYALQRDTTILDHCEYYATYVNPGRGYDTWFAIGQRVATRYSPGSSVLSSAGISLRKGVMHWAAINEPDANGDLSIIIVR